MSNRKDLTVFFIDTTAGVDIRYNNDGGELTVKDGPRLKRFADELKKQADHLFMLYQSSCLAQQLKDAKLYHMTKQRLENYDLEPGLKAMDENRFKNKYEA